MSWTGTVAGCTVAEQVRRIPTEPGRRFVWASSWTGERRLAVGTALDVTGSGADRFHQVSTSWRGLRDGALVGGTGRRPSLVGGFSFRHRDEGRGIMPDALMWLPAAELVEMPGSPTELTLNAWITPGYDVRAAFSHAENAACSLMNDSTVAETQQARVASVHETPSAFEWKLLVRRVLDAIATGAFEKLVLARQLAVNFDRPVAVAPVLAALIDQHRVGAVFGVQLGEHWLVGRTPECLLHLHDGRADTHALAGSVPRDRHPIRDAQLAHNLQTDPKLNREHAIVTDTVVGTMRRFFRDVRTDLADPVLKLADIQHRQTKISAVNPRVEPDLIRLAGALHPSPAVGGLPCAPAVRWLAANEPFDRGWYAAPIGWTGVDGGGELAVGIRSAMITGASAIVYAGCGIVDGSDPDDEYHETCVKMRQMLKVLGISDNELVAR
ncbi:isochorismate synthase [Mycobacterium sp.]|uniref:isochorismate synthase n=1 Tax=Mycobacterium sp. TaxID=1785 RepID=UPI003C796D2D